MHISCPCVRMKASVLKDCPYLAYFTLMVTRHIISFNNYIHSLILCSKRRKLLRNDNVTFRSIYFTRYYINLHHFETFFERDLFIQSFKQLVVGIWCEIISKLSLPWVQLLQQGCHSTEQSIFLVPAKPSLTFILNPYQTPFITFSLLWLGCPHHPFLLFFTYFLS